ncbi:hypothetical protein N7492_005552 [Penicillium capsulatum]|uniref:Developmental regulatory protein wetA n=1 Tax=Penicillium capsulatum TaxID=69766 RepID=A0A9W9LR49_9EURO|nr:hypothetical protein N7492_005552 [Penicillium capsulatum]KAJ6135348.1 hypothetical protein N7512_000508 [Penicillium capsulatum]
MFAQYHQSFNDLFNQYVNMEEGHKDPSLSGDFDQFFPLDSLSDCGDHSPTGSTSKRHPSPQPWSKDWSLQEDGAQFAFQDTVHPSAISDLGLNNFEVSSGPAAPTGISSTSPSTPPATPRRKATKSAIVTPKSIRHRDPNERRALLRKQSFSPSLMRSSHPPKGMMPFSESWAQRIQDFNLVGSDHRLPLSPPPSDVLVQHESMPQDPAMSHHRDSTEMPPQFFQQSPAVSMPSPSAGALARQQQQYMSRPSSSALTNSSPPSADEIFSSSHSSDPQSISSWQSDALGTSSIPFTPEFQNSEQAWWSPMPSRVSQQQTQYQPMVDSPTPQRSMQNVGGQNDMLQGGLMIQMDPSFDMSADSSFSSNMLPGSQKFVAPFTQPQMHSTTSRSPSLSPKAGGSPKGVSKGNQRRTHGRKLSGQNMNGPKPAKSTSPRGSKSANVSFVNFTANDHQRILTGVAPSGSSKTKARREQEARDRRRKMSEAALKAVRSAGGDVEALEAVFC